MLWDGRFKQNIDKDVLGFSSSIAIDKRLYKVDILGSIAYTKALSKAGIINKEEENKIIETLKEILKDIENNKIEFKTEIEDIHMCVESILIERIGEIGKKVHTGRSRNDQVSTDMRLYCREEVLELIDFITNLQSAIKELAENNIDVIMPGRTHLQHAQPVLFSHYIMAYFFKLQRDVERLNETFNRLNTMPLGSGALAGAGYPIDRSYLAGILKFDNISQNSVDAVSDRDFVCELIFDTAMIMTHLSSLCEELILWFTPEFNYIKIPDAFTTGSSIMPQKKNPDILELVRGKTGMVYGNLVSILTTLNGLPLSYNRDLQEDKIPLFNSIDTSLSSLNVITQIIKSIEINKEAMNNMKDYLLATDMADHLVKKGLPFRDAHNITGKIVSYALENKKELKDLSIDEYKKFYDGFDNGIYNVLSLKNSIENKDVEGGTATQRVKDEILKAKNTLENNKKSIKDKKEKICLCNLKK